MVKRYKYSTVIKGNEVSIIPSNTDSVTIQMIMNTLWSVSKNCDIPGCACSYVTISAVNLLKNILINHKITINHN